MSVTTREFYGVRCDYPECGVVYEGGEYSYWYDPGYAEEEARDDGDWLIGFEDKDYCALHCVRIDEDDLDPDDDDEFSGLRPLPDTVEARLSVVLQRVTARIDSAARTATRRVEEATSTRGWGNRWSTIEADMAKAFERACRAFKPEITSQELFDLRHKRPARA